MEQSYSDYSDTASIDREVDGFRAKALPAEERHEEHGNAKSGSEVERFVACRSRAIGHVALSATLSFT